MRSNIICLLATVGFMLVALSCSGSSPVVPTHSTQGGFAGGNPDGPLQAGPGPEARLGFGPGLWDCWDCERNFEVSYEGYFENTHNDAYLEFSTDGEIRILDQDCEADESDVLVHFDVEDTELWSCNMPGTKTVGADGTVYHGTRSMLHEMQHHTWTADWEFELTVTPDPDDPDVFVIEGWLEKVREDTWSNPDNGNGDGNKVTEATKTWYIDISGVEII